LNQGAFLRQTIESVLSQDYAPLEYLVVDGGSTDETLDILAGYGRRVRWISEPDQGQSDAINKGFRMASGEILCWLNGDDILLPGAIRRAVEALEEQPEAGFLYGGGRFLLDDGSIGAPFPHTQSFDLWRLVHVNDYILQQSCFFRRWALDEIGYVDPSLHWGLDWDLLIRLGTRFPVAYLPEELGCIREHPTAKTATGGRRRFEELKSVLRRHSGRRYPPGYFIYGLDTFKQSLRSAARRRLPRRLARCVETAASLVCDPIIRRSLDAQGWWSDGWAGPVVHAMLPPGAGRIRLEGEIPNWWHGSETQEISVQFNGERIAELALPPGRFLRLIQVPEIGDKPVELTLRAWDWRREEGGPRRKLAYRLSTVDWHRPAKVDHLSTPIFSMGQ
jgi:hypothetical protein